MFSNERSATSKLLELSKMSKPTQRADPRTQRSSKVTSLSLSNNFCFQEYRFTGVDFL